MRYIVYETTCLINKKIYVGVSNGSRRAYLGSGTVLKRAVALYGTKEFTVKTLKRFNTLDEAYTYEEEIVNENFVSRRDTYNMKVGGRGGKGQAKSAEHRRKISEALKGKSRKSNPNAGRKPSMTLEEIESLVAQHGSIAAAGRALGLNKNVLKHRRLRLLAKG
tara:strand:- start:1 stop:492 length:492 start_codon:yes stop_codon:yes gene_type:complete